MNETFDFDNEYADVQYHPFYSHKNKIVVLYREPHEFSYLTQIEFDAAVSGYERIELPIYRRRDSFLIEAASAFSLDRAYGREYVAISNYLANHPDYAAKIKVPLTAHETRPVKFTVVRPGRVKPAFDLSKMPLLRDFVDSPTLGTDVQAIQAVVCTTPNPGIGQLKNAAAHKDAVYAMLMMRALTVAPGIIVTDETPVSPGAEWQSAIRMAAAWREAR